MDVNWALLMRCIILANFAAPILWQDFTYGAMQYCHQFIVLQRLLLNVLSFIFYRVLDGLQSNTRVLFHSVETQPGFQ